MGFPMMLVLGTLALFLIIVTLNYRFFALLIVRLVKGRYSFAYVAVFKYFFKKSPGSVAIKDDVINHIYMFFGDKGCIKQKTLKPISFENAKFFEKKPKLLKKLGRPDFYSVFLLNESIGEVFGYSDVLFGANVRLLYFFLEKRFFLGEYCFGEKSEVDAEAVITGLSQKYLGKNQVDCDSACIISNENENTKLYYLNDGFSFRIIYFNQSNEAVNEQIRGFLNGDKDRTNKTTTQYELEMERL